MHQPRSPIFSTRTIATGRIALCVALASCQAAHAQSLYDTLRNRNESGLSAYVFVSANLSDATLIALARDARRAGMSLVLNGFVHEGPLALQDTQRRVEEINHACCAKNGAHWQINPLLYQRYRITATPSFVIARGSGDKPGDYSKVAGEMGIGNALKFFAQQSQIAVIRQRASDVYTKSFAEQ